MSLLNEIKENNFFLKSTNGITKTSWSTLSKTQDYVRIAKNVCVCGGEHHTNVHHQFEIFSYCFSIIFSFVISTQERPLTTTPLKEEIGLILYFRHFNV